MSLVIPILIAAALLAAALAIFGDRRAVVRRGAAVVRPGATGMRGAAAGDAAPEPTRQTRPRSAGAGACPLCLSRLGPGERIKSDLSPKREPGAPDRLMRIFGCPRCWPPRAELPRVCPVCGRQLPDDAWAVARYFERPGRRHVHVLGCTGCRQRRR